MRYSLVLNGLRISISFGGIEGTGVGVDSDICCGLRNNMKMTQEIYYHEKTSNNTTSIVPADFSKFCY